MFRDQLRSKVEGDVDIDTKKSVLRSLIKRMKVDQNGLAEIDFCVALGHTPYGVIRWVLTPRWYPFLLFHSLISSFQSYPLKLY
jgi:hypothetical protein